MRLFLSLFLLVSLLFGVELELDKTYSGPKKLSVSSLGANMGLPYHWMAVAKKGEGLLLFQTDTEDTIEMHSKNMDLTEAARYLNEKYELKNGLTILPYDSIVQISPHIYRRAYSVNGKEKEKAGLLYIVLGPQERAVVMYAYYDRAHENTMRVVTMNIAQALSFTPTKQLPSSMPDLKHRLKGAHVVYIKHDGTYDDKSELWLCSNGRYLLQEEHTAAEGMSRTKDQKYGQWSVENARLILKGDDGLEHQIDITLQDNALFLDGYRSFELANDQCN